MSKLPPENSHWKDMTDSLMESRIRGDVYVRFGGEHLKTYHSNMARRWVLSLHTEATGVPPVLEFFDGLGRSLRKKVIGFDGRAIYVDVVYNDKGQVEKSSEPYFVGETIYWNKNEYDYLGRTIKQIYPDDTYSKFEYDKLKTAYIGPFKYASIEGDDGENFRPGESGIGGIGSPKPDTIVHRTEKEMNFLGELIVSRDHFKNTVTYKYDVESNCIEVKGPRTTIKTEFDQMGNRIKLIDPDLGTVSYKYNVYGELISQTDAYGTRNLEYDSIGRIKKEVSKEGTTTYTYDTLKKGYLTSVKQETGTETNNTAQSFRYDEFGRIIEIAETIDGKIYETKTEFDKYNRVGKIIYPSNFAVVHKYNDYGYLEKVLNASTPDKAYWTADSINARGQLEKFTLGNNKVTTRIYDPEKGTISRIYTPGVQDWEYKFSIYGTLTSRKDIGRNKIERFEYDKLHRLRTTYRNDSITEQLTYDAAGNITSKTNIGTYHYVDGTNRLDHIKSSTYKPKNFDVINYTSFNKVQYAKQGNNYMHLHYGFDKQRKRMITNKGLERTSRHYIGSLYEVDIKPSGETIKRHHIMGGGGAVAIVEQSDRNPEKTLYLHKDHLGSVMAFTDEVGGLVEELSYDAWGRRRNPVTWAYVDLLEVKPTYERGFTGHEHLDLFEVINMNGRMYDPMLGIFLSPDPYVQAPDNTQSLNRYIYCLNNPLSMTDPSGYSWLSENWKSVTAAIVGITVATLTAGAGASFGVLLLAGAAGGAASGLVGAALNGTNVMQGVMQGAFWGAVGAGTAFGVGQMVGSSIVAKIFMHGFRQGTIDAVQGGNFMHGFMSGAASAGGGAAMGGKWANGLGKGGKTAMNAALGGTVSAIGGGKFANGAITGAYTYLFNCLQQQKKNRAVSLLNHSENTSDDYATKFFARNLSDDPNDGNVYLFAHGAEGGGAIYDKRSGQNIKIMGGKALHELLMKESAEYKSFIDSGKAVTVFLFVCSGSDTGANGMNIAASLSKANQNLAVNAVNGIIRIEGNIPFNNPDPLSSASIKNLGKNNTFIQYKNGIRLGSIDTKFGYDYTVFKK